ncbi:hypothetical protein HPP92_005820 [Vanilla planifolia]|uniref:Uncharacterized protein n=1 Tax=Vanilla planifolia TaxID=51239 RepID=A0A835RV73_VANPL|nr:hypothetical protein HPP92_005820 [Vanilla planifolia]
MGFELGANKKESFDNEEVGVPKRAITSLEGRCTVTRVSKILNLRPLFLYRTCRLNSRFGNVVSRIHLFHAVTPTDDMSPTIENPNSLRDYRSPFLRAVVLVDINNDFNRTLLVKAVRYGLFSLSMVSVNRVIYSIPTGTTAPQAEVGGGKEWTSTLTLRGLCKLDWGASLAPLRFSVPRPSPGRPKPFRCQFGRQPSIPVHAQSSNSMSRRALISAETGQPSHR